MFKQDQLVHKYSHLLWLVWRIKLEKKHSKKAQSRRWRRRKQRAVDCRICWSRGSIILGCLNTLWTLVVFESGQATLDSPPVFGWKALGAKSGEFRMASFISSSVIAFGILHFRGINQLFLHRDAGQPFLRICSKLCIFHLQSLWARIAQKPHLVWNSILYPCCLFLNSRRLRAGAVAFPVDVSELPQLPLLDQMKPTEGQPLSPIRVVKQCHLMHQANRCLGQTNSSSISRRGFLLNWRWWSCRILHPACLGFSMSWPQLLDNRHFLHSRATRRQQGYIGRPHHRFLIQVLWPSSPALGRIWMQRSLGNTHSQYGNLIDIWHMKRFWVVGWTYAGGG